MLCLCWLMSPTNSSELFEDLNTDPQIVFYVLILYTEETNECRSRCICSVLDGVLGNIVLRFMSSTTIR